MKLIALLQYWGWETENSILYTGEKKKIKNHISAKVFYFEQVQS